MRALPLALSALLLGGCATFQFKSVPTYQPYIVDVRDEAQKNHDVENCRDWAQHDPHNNISVARSVSKGGQNTGTNLPSLAAKSGWLLLLLAFVGGSLGEVSDQLNVTDTKALAEMIDCVKQETGRDGSGVDLDQVPTP